MKYLSLLNKDITQKIVNLIVDLQKHWNQKDVSSLSELFTVDLEFIDNQGRISLGKERLIDFLIHQLSSGNSLSNFEIINLYMRPISDEIILVNAYYKQINTEENTCINGNTSIICKGHKGLWKIHIMALDSSSNIHTIGWSLY